MNMTQEQKDYINNVILPRLVEMAINDELDSDMNLLSYHDFEEATEKYNNSPEQVKARQIEALKQYLCEDDDSGITYESQLEVIKSYKGDKLAPLCSIDGLCPTIPEQYTTIQYLIHYHIRQGSQ